MFALFYADNQEFITTLGKAAGAFLLGQVISQVSKRDILVVLNGSNGNTQVCCCMHEGAPDIPAETLLH